MSEQSRLEKARRLLVLRWELQRLASERKAYADEFQDLKHELELEIDAAVEAGEQHPAPCLPQIDYRIDGGMTRIIFRNGGKR